MRCTFIQFTVPVVTYNLVVNIIYYSLLGAYLAVVSHFRINNTSYMHCIHSRQSYTCIHVYTANNKKLIHIINLAIRYYNTSWVHINVRAPNVQYARPHNLASPKSKIYCDYYQYCYFITVIITLCWKNQCELVFFSTQNVMDHNRKLKYLKYS